MTRLISMAYLTAASLTPPEAVRLAAELGYDGLGLRIAPVAPGGAFAALSENRALLAETRRALSQTGQKMLDVEIARLGADFEPKALLPFLETCAALGARAVLVAGDDPDEARLTESFAKFCEAAAPFGLTGDLEFMPWTRVPDARTALRIVEAAGAPNGRVLVDALHFARSTSTLADIEAIPPARLGYAQICDAPADIPTTDEGLIHTARQARLLPGDGGIDLVNLFRRLPRDLPVSVEIPNAEGVARHGAREWARLALEGTRATLRESDQMRI